MARISRTSATCAWASARLDVTELLVSAMLRFCPFASARPLAVVLAFEASAVSEASSDELDDAVFLACAVVVFFACAMLLTVRPRA